MKLVSSLIAMGALQLANGEIIIHNNHIEESIKNLGHWASEEINSKQFGQLARAVMTANEHASIQNLHANDKIMKHFLHLAHKSLDVTHHFIPKDCSADKYASCMSDKENWKQDASGWGQQWNEKDIHCWKQADCLEGWNHQSKQSQQELKKDFEEITNDAKHINHEYWWATDNWNRDIKDAVESHQQQLEKVADDLEGEVEHLMVSGGCNEQCVQKMKADGMLDDPSYIAYECKCASKWIEYQDNQIEVVPETDLVVKPAKPAAVAPAKSTSDSIHLTEFTCACLVIFAVQAVLCFAMVAWCNSRMYKTERSKTIKNSEFYEFLYEFHEQMANEGDANAAIEGTPGGTPGGPTPGGGRKGA